MKSNEHDQQGQLAQFMVNTDCRLYVGEKPCKAKRLCYACPDYAPMGLRVLIIKFGAMGDALRTTPILRALKSRATPTHVTWITDHISYPLLEGNPLIDRLWLDNHSTLTRLLVEKFDLVYSMDKVPQALALAELAHAPRKLGFRMSPEGNLDCYNAASRYSLLLGVSDPVKFHQNKQTYQEIMFQMLETPYQREDYVLHVSDDDHRYAKDLLANLGITHDRLIIGLNTGCGPIFATKKWTAQGFIELAKLLAATYNCHILLLGGTAERDRNREIEQELPGIAINTGNDQSIKRFAAIIGECDLLVTGDTVAMHIAIALGIEVVAFFGPTCAQEIDLYNRGELIVTDFACAPCYFKVCPKPHSCMQALSAEAVFAALQRRITLAGLLA